MESVIPPAFLYEVESIFVGQFDEFYKMNVNGSGLEQLTTNVADDYEPTFSSNGNFSMLKRAGFKDFSVIGKFICFEIILAIK